MPAQLPALDRTEPGDALATRLSDEFANFPPDAVHRCVADVQARMSHLGLEPTPPRVERMAREHLTGMLKSEPPSGRSPGGGADG
ncbi:hypothetical protein [Actinomadura sp. WMMB 499]|uniref:hypothetical protein n=1 Tax=Actinomadura sp. WMMB 499 TaxID=1219491 RepID=UPI0012488C03|nr:hypothetical protein [Actinomadura sp. WMMB 499]QFG21014.1 hypothetical protein F7P10_07510 [Actinomadura sp. WMMB 499]